MRLQEGDATTWCVQRGDLYVAGGLAAAMGPPVFCGSPSPPAPPDVSEPVAISSRCQVCHLLVALWLLPAGMPSTQGDMWEGCPSHID